VQGSGERSHVSKTGWHDEVGYGWVPTTGTNAMKSYGFKSASTTRSQYPAASRPYA
jgi:hypothetical protein